MKIHTDSPSNPLVLVVSRVNEVGAASFTFDPPRISPTPHARFPVQSYLLVPLRTALTRHYQGEALFDSTRIAGLSSSHRITRAGARSLFAHAPRAHTAIEIPVLYFDFDNGAHCRWNAEQAARFGAHLDEVLWRHDLTFGGAWYTTRGGWRFVQPLAKPVVLTSDADIELHEARLRAYGAQLDAIIESGFADFDLDGLPFAKQHDPSCDTWSHLFRVPHATRDGVLQQLPMSMDRLRAWDGYSSLTPLYAPGESPEEIAAARAAAEVRAAEQRALRAKREAARAANPRAILSPSLRPKGADWNSIDLIEFFRARGELRQPVAIDKVAVVCPWNDEHTTGEAGDSGTVIFTGGARHTFYCSHSHCRGRGLPDLRNLDPHAYDAACREQWIPTGDSPAFAARKAAEAAENARIVANFRRRGTISSTVAAALGDATPSTPAAKPLVTPIVRTHSGIAAAGALAPTAYVPNRTDIAAGLSQVDRRRAAICAGCGSFDKGYRNMNRLTGPKGGQRYRAPFACKKTVTCPNCAAFFADRRAESLVAVVNANPQLHFAARAFTVTADTPEACLMIAFAATADIMPLFRGIPACRFVCVNNSRLASQAYRINTNTITIQFLFALPRSQKEREALFSALDSYRAGGVAHADTRCVFVPRANVSRFVVGCLGWVPVWADQPDTLDAALPALDRRKLYLGNKALRALEKSQPEKTSEMVSHGADLDLVEQLKPHEQYLVCIRFAELIARQHDGGMPVELVRGSRGGAAIDHGELFALRAKVEPEWRMWLAQKKFETERSAVSVGSLTG